MQQGQAALAPGQHPWPKPSAARRHCHLGPSAVHLISPLIRRSGQPIYTLKYCLYSSSTANILLLTYTPTPPCVESHSRLILIIFILRKCHSSLMDVFVYSCLFTLDGLCWGLNVISLSFTIRGDLRGSSE